MPVTECLRPSCACRYVEDPDASVQALAGVWQLLDTALTMFGSDSNVAERLCRLPRYALRSAGTAAAPLLPMLVVTLPARFVASGHSCYLYVASELVKVFGSDSTHEAAIGASSCCWSVHCHWHTPAAQRASAAMHKHLQVKHLSSSFKWSMTCRVSACRADARWHARQVVPNAAIPGRFCRESRYRRRQLLACGPYPALQPAPHFARAAGLSAAGLSSSRPPCAA